MLNHSMEYFSEVTINFITEFARLGAVSITINDANDWNVTFETDDVYIYDSGMFLPDVLLHIHNIVNNPDELVGFYK